MRSFGQSPSTAKFHRLARNRKAMKPAQPKIGRRASVSDFMKARRAPTLSARAGACNAAPLSPHVSRWAYSFRRNRSSDSKPEVDERLEGIGKSLRQSRKEEHGKRAVRRQCVALRRASPIEVLDVKRQALRDADCRGDQRHDNIFVRNGDQARWRAPMESPSTRAARRLATERLRERMSSRRSR